ncbi:MAG TPA: polysaccharide deacetylase family protein [Saprospiraceae bacterium]|nr:polysaccharide deacetylase family protein [Saprospiraceae bacterium]
MGLQDDYVKYPMMQYGMDHYRYPWSMLADRSPVRWPNGAMLAFTLHIHIQHFPLNQKGIPLKVPGGMTMPYPDLRHYSLRDYGNRVGIYRILKTIDRYQMRPTFSVNAQICQMYPYLMKRLFDRDAEIIAHGWNMDSLHCEGMSEKEERELIGNTLNVLNKSTPMKIKGWLSPAGMESFRTPDIVGEMGVEYLCDWVNDDLPYYFNTQSGELIAYPVSQELDDYMIIMNNSHSEASFVDQCIDAINFLINEGSQQGGRLLTISVHPWIMGHAHRITFLEVLFSYILSRKEIWMAHPCEVIEVWKRQNKSHR